MDIKKPIIVLIGLVLISTTIVGAYVSVNGIKLPDDPVILTAVDGTSSYFIITLSDIPAGSDVTTGPYPGWCADRDVTMVRAIGHNVRLYDSYDPSLPAPFQDSDWDKINWILNNKDAYSMQTIQDAFWYLLGDYTWGQLSTSAQNLVTSAQDGYTPHAGDILAIVAVPEPRESDCQCTFFELCIPGNYEGLTPGYWKNIEKHAWPSPYTPNTLVSSVFTGVSHYSELTGDHLIDALQYQGGRGDIGAARILLRSAVGALLNAAHPDINYPLSPSIIIQDVNDALASHDRDTMLDLKDVLDGYNNLGADL
jgi:hypothetical protein